jgi:N6-adenosine-specific RNA methylase IME4
VIASVAARRPAPVDRHGVLQDPLWTPTSLALPDDLSFESWRDIGTVLGQLDRSLQWWMGDWWRYGEHRYGHRAAEALDSRWAFQTWANAGYVAGVVEPSRRREVLSWSHHAEVAPLARGQQEDWLNRAQTGGWSRNELRTAIRQARVTAPGILPAGKYAVLLADPPWRFDFVIESRAVENHYPTLRTGEIECFHDSLGRSVADLAADDAVLFLWATNPLLPDALAVMAAWGFEYKTNLVWVKDHIGLGWWVRGRHELLLVGTRGTISPPPPHLRPDSVIDAARGIHSAKPANAYDLIESVWPDVPKVELFARSRRDGWSAFGNQLAEDVA